MQTKSKLIIGIVVAVSLAFIGYSYFKTLSKDKNGEKPAETPEMQGTRMTTEAEASLLKQNEAALETFTQAPTPETLVQFLQKIDADLKTEGLSDETKNTLLLRKAGALSLSLGGDPKKQEASTDEALKIYRDLIALPLSEKLEANYFHDYAVAAGVKLQLRTLQKLTLLDLSLPADQTGSYNFFRGKNYGEGASALLALHEVTKKISQGGKDDIVNTANAIQIESALFSHYGSSLVSETYQGLLNDFKGNLALYPRAKAKTFTDYQSTKVEPGYHFALGLDTYHSLDPGKRTGETNQEIDKQYESYVDTLSADSTLNARQMVFYAEVAYLESLNRRYGGAVDANKVNARVQKLLSIIRSSKEMEAMASGYLKSGSDDPAIKNFISLGKTNSAVAEYLKSIGVQY